MRPDLEIEGCRAAQELLDERLDGLDAGALRRPSLLPGWSVAHVLGHLVGNAESVVRRLRGVVEDRVTDQYPRGEQGRADEIEALALLPRDALLVAVRRSSAEVGAIFDEVPDEAWDRLSRSVSGKLLPAHLVVFSRWREVVVHHTDLGLGFSVAEWPPALVSRWLPDALAGLPARTDPSALLAWAIGRGPAPEPEPWG
jgi:maleylpyruvate isomerase